MAAKRAEVEDQRELFHEIAERMVKEASAVFTAKRDEVAILMSTSTASTCASWRRASLRASATIPSTKRDSIAVGVFEKKTGEVMNNVPMNRHVAFFESVKMRDRVVPIQKMITVPITPTTASGGRRPGSRKGESRRRRQGRTSSPAT